MQTFESGATRTEVQEKLSYLRALSPAVLRKYAAYLQKHRKQPDGSVREFDNWKKGIPQDRYMDGLLRHVWDAWLVFLGYMPSDESYDMDDLLCAIIFNAHGLLFERNCNPRRENLEFTEEIILDDHPDRSRCTRVPITDPARLLPAGKTCGDCARVMCFASEDHNPCSNFEQKQETPNL